MRLEYKSKIRVNFIVNLCLFFLLIIIVYAGTKNYISQENFIYSWDYIGYQKNTDTLIEEFNKSFIEGLIDFIASLFSDYSKLFCVPILPLYLAMGTSRLSFILSITLVYLVSFSLVMGVVFSKLVSKNQWQAFWLASFVTILTPAAWLPLLRGYPDLGGASLFMVGILMYWQDTSLKSRRNALNISYLMSALVIFRRHFAYAFRSFIVAVLFQNFIRFIFSKINKKIKSNNNLRFIFLRIFLMLFVFLLLSIHLLIKVFYFNYRELYASYEESPLKNIFYYASLFGWLIIALVVIGYSLSLFHKEINKEKLGFLAILGIVTSLQWIFSSKQLGVHYTTHFLPFVVLGVCLCIWSSALKFRRVRFNISIFLILIILLSTNICVSLGALQWGNQYSQLLFARREPPLFRGDDLALSSFIKYLRDNTNPDEPIYVAASSYEILNKSILEELEKKFYKNKTLNIIRTSDIDSRDFYPLNGLVNAQYVIVAEPMQYHINPDEQKVITVVGDIFRNKLLIANDFERISQEFVFDRGVTAYIYKRIRNSSIDTILDTLQLMERRLNRNLGRETYWLSLNSGQSTVIERDALFKTTHISPLIVSTTKSPSLLFFGKILKTTKIDGKINIMSDCSAVNSILFRATALSSNKAPVEKKFLTYKPKMQMPFSFMLNSEGASFIELDLALQNNSNPSNTCMISLNHVVVSH